LYGKRKENGRGGSGQGENGEICPKCRILLRKEDGGQGKLGGLEIYKLNSKKKRNFSAQHKLCRKRVGGGYLWAEIMKNQREGRAENWVHLQSW